jgi:hypothetical protein
MFLDTGSESQRATYLGMLNSIGQCLSILASFSFPDKEGPRFIKGITLNIAFASVSRQRRLFACTAY